MYVKEVTVQTQVGLYARAATYFIQKANEFNSAVWIEQEDRRINAKSLLGVLSLGVSGGDTISIIADGDDERQAVDALVNLVLSGFTSSEQQPVSYEPPLMINDEKDQKSVWVVGDLYEFLNAMCAATINRENLHQLGTDVWVVDSNAEMAKKREMLSLALRTDKMLELKKVP